ncbi:MAG: alpha/beta hydrolase [Planctomycetota bacterium]|nr:alpha/beta hydrolase [Planctomycetota bacterium]
MLAYDRYGQRQGDEPAILFLHGWCEHRKFWKPTASILQESHMCVAVDVPGYGGSTYQQGGANPLDWASQVATFVRSIDDGPWIVVGHSMGGVIALETARILQDSGQAHGVVVVHGLYDPNRKFDVDMNMEFASALEADFSGQIEHFVNAMVPPKLTGALSEWIATQMKTTQKRVAIDGLMAHKDYDLEACLKALTVPVRAINAKMRTTHTSANKRLLKDFEVYILDSIEGPGLGLMLQDPTGFRALLGKALQDFRPTK